MSKSKPKLLFNKWTLWDLNPLNYALKNDFMENLVYIAYCVNSIVDHLGEDVKIVKAFCPESMFKDAVGKEKKHSYGNAIALTWKGYDKDDVKANPIFTMFVDKNNVPAINVMIYSDRVMFFVDSDDSTEPAYVAEDTNGSYRVIYKSNCVM